MLLDWEKSSIAILAAAVAALAAAKRTTATQAI